MHNQANCKLIFGSKSHITLPNTRCSILVSLFFKCLAWFCSFIKIMAESTLDASLNVGMQNQNAISCPFSHLILAHFFFQKQISLHYLLISSVAPPPPSPPPAILILSIALDSYNTNFRMGLSVISTKLSRMVVILAIWFILYGFHAPPLNEGIDWNIVNYNKQFLSDLFFQVLFSID